MQPVLGGISGLIVSFIFLILGVMGGSFLIWRRGRYQFDAEKMFDAILIVILVGVFGGRLTSVFLNLEKFRVDLVRFFHPFLFPGFYFWGSVIFGILAVYWYCRRENFSFWSFLDLGVFGLAVGQIFVKIGFLLNGNDFGGAARFPWGRLPHPVALYDLILITVIIVLLGRWESEAKRREGATFLIYFLFYGTTSFVLGFLRQEPVIFWNLTLNQTFSLICVTAAGVILYFRQRILKGDLAGLVTSTRNLVKMIKGGRRINGISE